MPTPGDIRFKDKTTIVFADEQFKSFMGHIEIAKPPPHPSMPWRSVGVCLTPNEMRRLAIRLNNYADACEEAKK